MTTSNPTHVIAREPAWHRSTGSRVFFSDTHGDGTSIGDVVRVTGPTDHGDDVSVEGLATGWRISAACLEPIHLTDREPLTFAAAYEKAVAHRGTPTSAKQVAKTVRLAELLIEVSA